MNASAFKAFLRRNLPFILFLVLAFAVRWSLLDQYVVPSGSMEPTIEVGDHILVNKMAFGFRLPYTSLELFHGADPQRGDIVVFENPKDYVTMVKRLIGLPGDHLVIDDGFVTINDKPLDGDIEGRRQLYGNEASEGSETPEDKPEDKALRERLVNGDPLVYHEQINSKSVTIKRLPFMLRPHHLEFTVPADSYFAMGDNRDNSADSRVWGFIPRPLLKGRAFAVFWSGRLVNFVPHMRWERTGQSLQ